MLEPAGNKFGLPAVIIVTSIIIIIFGLYTSVIRSSCEQLYQSYEDTNEALNPLSDEHIYELSKWSSNVIVGFNVGLFMAYFTPNSTIRKPSLIIFSVVMGILAFQTIWYLYKLNEQNCPGGKEETEGAFPIFYSYLGWSIGVLIGTLAETLFGGYSVVTQIRIGFIVFTLQILVLLGLGFFTVRQCHTALGDDESILESNEELRNATGLYLQWSGWATFFSLLILVLMIGSYYVYPESKAALFQYDLNRFAYSMPRNQS